MQAARDFSHYVRHLEFRAVAYRSGGRGRQLRRLHVEDRARALRAARRDAGAGQPDRPPRGAGVEGRHAGSGALHRPPGGARLQGLSVRAGSCRSGRDRAGELSAALSRRRRLCGDERHDAVDPGVVRQCRRHDPGAARFLPLAVGADRLAGGGLFRTAVLPLRLARLAGAAHQHGRADLDRHRDGAWHVGGRDDQSRRTRLFRRRADAARLPAGRPLPRPEHAPQDPRGGRQPRRAEGGDRDQIRRGRRDQRRADRSRCRPATSCCCARASARRSTAS